jgi:hypothetical protein
MSTAEDIAEVYDEIEEEDRDEECLIGLLRIHSDGRLELVAAEPERAAFLQQVTDRMNSKAEIAVHSEEPPSEPFELPATTIERGDPRFPEALLTYVSSHYGLRIA